MRENNRGHCLTHPSNKAVACCEHCGMPLCYACDHKIKGRHYCSRHAQEMTRRLGWANLAEPARVEFSRRRWAVAMVLGIAGGIFGAHRFYLGRWVSGLCQACLPILSMGAAAQLPYFTLREYSPLGWFFGILLAFGLLDRFFDLFDAAFLTKRIPIPFFGIRSIGLRYLMNKSSGHNRRVSSKIQARDSRMAALLLVGLDIFLVVRALGSGEASVAAAAAFAAFLLSSGAAGIWLSKDLAKLYHNDFLDASGRVPS